jgi:hypothetical protein
MEAPSMLLTMLKAGKGRANRRLKRSNIIDYELTERGQNFLISCEGVLFCSGVLSAASVLFQVPYFARGRLSDGRF